jgi:stage II sporulation protein D
VRRLLAAGVFFALVFSASASAAPVFYVWGKGWGHGIGMPQYGAQGYAQHGKPYRWILAHFYPGTEAGQAGRSRIRVLLDVGRSSVTLRSPSTWTVEDGKNRSWDLAVGSRTMRPGLKLWIGGKKRQLVPPVTFRRASGRPISVDGNPYRGAIMIRKPGSRLAIVNHLGVQPYLKGVIAQEMPSDWHPEALKAQAVAARSYALSHLTSGTYFDVYDDTRSQVYDGVEAEEPSTNAAVTATAGEVRRYRGALAETFFYSSSGGRTAANEDVWGSSPIPYLRSVADPWDTISPHHTWGPTRYSRRALDAALGGYVPGTLRDMVVSVNPSRRAGTVQVVGTGGRSPLSGEQLRYVLNLKSSWFRIGVLNLVPADATVVYGNRVRLRGLARSVGKAWLETRRPDGAWRTLRDLELGDASRFSTLVRPTVPRAYRVRSARGASSARLVRVATKVLLAKPTGRTRLAGIVRPRRAGVTVTVQRLRSGRWTAVANGKTNADGDFSIAFEVKNGTYRALATVSGLLRGVSPTLKIVS